MCWLAIGDHLRIWVPSSDEERTNLSWTLADVTLRAMREAGWTLAISVAARSARLDDHAGQCSRMYLSRLEPFSSRVPFAARM